MRKLRRLLESVQDGVRSGEKCQQPGMHPLRFVQEGMSDRGYLFRLWEKQGVEGTASSGYPPGSLNNIKKGSLINPISPHYSSVRINKAKSADGFVIRSRKRCCGFGKQI